MGIVRLQPGGHPLRHRQLHPDPAAQVELGLAAAAEVHEREPAEGPEVRLRAAPVSTEVHQRAEGGRGGGERVVALDLDVAEGDPRLDRDPVTHEEPGAQVLDRDVDGRDARVGQAEGDARIEPELDGAALCQGRSGEAQRTDQHREDTGTHTHTPSRIEVDDGRPRMCL